jgi:hypothetical protein
MIEQNGQVAIKYFQQIPQNVQIGQDHYTFWVKSNVCMAWVKKEHVKQVLDITKTCCRGNKTHPYKLANELDVRLWEGRN